MNISDLIKNNKTASISHFYNGELWYVLENGFKFPVPVNDTNEIGNATFNATEKSILLMRYIRKHIESISNANAS